MAERAAGKREAGSRGGRLEGGKPEGGGGRLEGKGGNGFEPSCSGLGVPVGDGEGASAPDGGGRGGLLA